MDKKIPIQVTYTQLDLGDNYRTYNHRQSNPNVKASVSDLSHGEGSGTFERRRLTNHERGRSLSTTKSAPVTPRALSPSRSVTSTNLYLVRVYLKLAHLLNTDQDIRE